MVLDELIGKQVVLDTAGPLVYLGVLEQVTPEGFWLRDADVHDRNDGQAGKELYVTEARRLGIVPNRKRVFVIRSVVMSISALEDVIED